MGQVESDDYCRNVTCGERVLSGVAKLGGKSSHATVGGDGTKPSGGCLPTDLTQTHTFGGLGP